MYDIYLLTYFFCSHDNLNTIADACLLLKLEKNLNKFTCQGQGQGCISDSSRSLSKVLSDCIAGSEILSLMTSFSVIDCQIFVALLYTVFRKKHSPSFYCVTLRKLTNLNENFRHSRE